MFLIVLALILVVSIIAPFLLMGMGANAATVSGTEAARYATLAASYGYQQVLQKIESYYPSGISSSNVPTTSNPIMLTTSPQALLQALQEGYSSEQSITSISGDSFSVRVPAYPSSTNTYTIGITGTYLPSSGTATQATTDVLLSFSPFGVTMQGSANINIQSSNQSVWVAGGNLNDQSGTVQFDDSSMQTIYTDGNQYYNSNNSLIKNSSPVESTGEVTGITDYSISESYKNLIDSTVTNQFPTSIPTSPFETDYSKDTGSSTVINYGSTTNLSAFSSYNGPWYYSGNVNVTSTPVLSSNDFVVNGNLTVESGESLTISSGNLLVGGNVTVDSGGSITVSSKDACIQGSLTLNGGTMNVSAGSLYINENISDSGTDNILSVSRGNLLVGNNITVSGSKLTVTSENLYQGFSSNESMCTIDNGGSLILPGYVVMDTNNVVTKIYGNLYTNGGVELSGSPINSDSLKIETGNFVSRGLMMTNGASMLLSGYDYPNQPMSSGSVYVDGLSSAKGSAPTMLTGLSRTAP
nr:hypothetical protein [Bacilli bacterium]